MKARKLLTGAALLALGVTGVATSQLAQRRAWAQSGQNTAEPKTKGESGSHEGADTKATKQKNSAEPELGTRGESGRAGPMKAADAGVNTTEPEQGYTEPQQKAAPPPKGSDSDKPHSNKFEQNKSGGDRDPLPSGSETASPTHRASRPW